LLRRAAGAKRLSRRVEASHSPAVPLDGRKRMASAKGFEAGQVRSGPIREAGQRLGDACAWPSRSGNGRDPLALQSPSPSSRCGGTGAPRTGVRIAPASENLYRTPYLQHESVDQAAARWSRPPRAGGDPHKSIVRAEPDPLPSPEARSKPASAALTSARRPSAGRRATTSARRHHVARSIW
jgi:hypothetical protein